MDPPESSAASRLIASLRELKAATVARHRLYAATPEYRAALDEEFRLVGEVRRLIAVQHLEDDRRPARGAPAGTRGAQTSRRAAAPAQVIAPPAGAHGGARATRD
jgi:hypothetical protein